MTIGQDLIDQLTSGGDARLTPARPDLAAARLDGVVAAERYVEGQDHQVTAFATPLYAAPSADGPLLTELRYGEPFEVLAQKDGWAWGQSKVDHYVGYTPASWLSPMEGPSADEGCTVTETLVDAYKEPDIKSPLMTRFPMHAVLRKRDSDVVGDCRFLQIEEGAWLRADLVFEWNRKGSPWPKGEDHILLARKFLGAPYRWGGRTAMGIDCSGLLQTCGVAQLRDTDLQERELAVRAEAVGDQPRREGDIVFFPGHVGMMVDQDHLIHANAYRMRVSIDPLAEVIERISREQAEPIRSIYRLPDSSGI